MVCLMAHKGRYGAGSIRRSDEGRWELRVSVGRDPVTGPLVGFWLGALKVQARPHVSILGTQRPSPGSC